MSSVESLACAVEALPRRCWRRGFEERGRGDVREEMPRGEERKRGRAKEDEDVVAFCLRLNEILGIGQLARDSVEGKGRFTALGDRDPAGRRLGGLLHRCGHLRRRAACRVRCGSTMLQLVRVGTAWMASWTCPRVMLWEGLLRILHALMAISRKSNSNCPSVVLGVQG
jgi:hypothetical protein